MIYDGLFKTSTVYFEIISSTTPSHCIPSIFFSMLSYRSNGSYKVFVKIKLKKANIFFVAVYFRPHRYARYRLFSWWIQNQMSKGVRKVILSCAIWSTPEKYPSADDTYIPFKKCCNVKKR